MPRIDRGPSDLPTGARPDRPVAFAITELRRGRADRRPAAIVVLLVAFVVLAVVKPWAGSSGPSGRAPVAATAEAIVPASRTSSPQASPGPAGQAVVTELPLGGPVIVPPPSTQTISAIEALFNPRAGSWGVGDGGSGPRLVRDDPWSDWAPVTPFAAEAYPASLLQWPGTALCSGASDLLDVPSVVALTTPPGLGAGWTGSGWWSDGAAIHWLAGTLAQLARPSGGSTIFLVRRDGQRWPDGRYELHLRSGSRTVAITFCLGRG